MAGQVAIVTGSAAGIGRACALAFGLAGARVVVNYSRSQTEAEETADLVRGVGAEALVLPADVGRVSEIEAMVQRTLDTWDRVDVLVNNAGTTVFAPYTDLDAMTEEAWDRILAVNLKAVYFATRAVAAPMKAQGSGKVINIASIAGIRPVGSSIAYCASKAGVISLTETMALALAPEVQVNAIAPGYIATRWHAGRDEAARQAQAATPLQRNGSPEDIAEIALFLATRDAFITGEVIVADGGRFLR